MIQEPEPLSCPYSQDRGRAEHRLDGLEAGTEQDDLRRAWPVSWNLGFWDSQRYGYTGEIHRGWRQSLEGMRLHIARPCLKTKQEKLKIEILHCLGRR